MDAYILQLEDLRLPFDRLHSLGSILSEELTMPHVDAVQQIRQAWGILPVPAERAPIVSERFRQAGFANVVLDRLFDEPPVGHLEWQQIQTEAILAVVAPVDSVREQVIGSRPGKGGDYGDWWPIVADKVIRKYHFDIFTKTCHCRFVLESLPQTWTDRLRSIALPGYQLRMNERIVFRSEVDLGKYVHWAFQISSLEIDRGRDRNGG